MITIRTNIYVVDDDASVRRSLARVVRSAGHNAVAFASAKDFFASDYRTGEDGCLIVDAKMPRSSGLDNARFWYTINKTDRKQI